MGKKNKHTLKILFSMLVIMGLLGLIGSPVITGAAVANGEFPEHTSLGRPYQPPGEEVKPLSVFESEHLEPIRFRETDQ